MGGKYGGKGRGFRPRNEPVPQASQVMAAKPVRFVLIPDKVETVQEIATLLGIMGLGVVGPGGYEALVFNGVEHLFEREHESQIISQGIVGIPQKGN